MKASKKRALLLARVAKGESISAAARALGVARGTAGRWALEANKTNKTNSASASRGRANAENAATAGKPATSPASRARAERARALAEKLGVRLRGNLRDSIEHLTTYVEQETRRSVEPLPVGDAEGLAAWAASRPDMQQVAAASRALDTLLDRAADLLAIDERTTPVEPPAALDPTTPDGRAALVEQLRRVPRDLLEAALAPAEPG